MTERDILKAAIDRWGHVAQLDMAVEECAELIKAICKIRRSGYAEKEVEDIIDEIADVRLMMTQLAYMFGEDRVSERMDYKINRLKERINSYDKARTEEYEKRLPE